MYDLDELQTKHLKDILKIKADAARTNSLVSQNKEAEAQDQFTKYNKISELEEELEEARNEIKRLKEEMKQKEREFSNTIIEFKRREAQNLAKQRDKKLRPQEMMESSESESSEDREAELLKKKAKERKINNMKKDIIQNKKKVGRNDLLNLPSSDDEKIVKKLKNLHEPSSFEKEKSEDDSEDAGTKMNKRKSSRKKNRRLVPIKGKKVSNLARRVRTGSFDHDYDDKLDDGLETIESEESKKKTKPKSPSPPKKNKDEKHFENPSVTKQKLEDAEYKDLNKRMNQDERDIHFVLNNQEAIYEAVNKEEDETANELNESIEKIEEEQDIDFKTKVTHITKDFMRDFKKLDPENDAFEIEQLHKAMVQKIFENFIENKQDMLKKIASKLASQNNLDDYGWDGSDDDGYHDSSRLRPHRKSEVSYNSRKSKNSHNRK